MSSEIEITVIRHGETDWNREGRIQGHRQVGLNSHGRLQAAAVAQGLAGERFDAVYSSDLIRARETAEAIAAVVGRRVTTDSGLREWDLGVLAGETHGSAARHYPQTFAIYRAAIADAVVPGGESIRQRHRRVVAAMESIARTHRGGRVVVVTHGGPLDDCYRRANALPLEVPRDFSLYNASLNRFVLNFRGEDVTWALTTWGDIQHLSGMDVLGSRVGINPS